MSNFAPVIIIVLLLTVLGTLTLLLVTLKYYWGARGNPPLTGDARKRQKAEELQSRAAQIEYSKKNPWKTRSRNFWDNRKSSSK